ncbi:MAG: hypothetical protein A2898_04860 [Candidatus Kerfeldbacteria bacterium RIFCSPLOWO2_01_FULL_48_11]|uniref:Uncharacterized protein n=1 Tax=Candidatus Kerfeldbacteria bacterium RIFCSPLOWO2_01_FULL_48_11 TaxID=1798543 RepID=A0A1G2B142_9BACT|nr:MAG: hypothetical protein UY52_C0016G0063 [Parcubacteria group bacterium GW2011_GWC2_49_9]OGY82884.1 MAG: hypothetical protein A2898_04860 [Candidatus Kerfeldbacteria bacterium RIFCSPLOWO2_01_FULL_48_11]HCJ52097.1 hypothetical protein [Candidatus Kerfeldbacteria bacterium]HCM68431.1 hypothetical protein [Candidatus Kerfeldbacteria bacterium]
MFDTTKDILYFVLALAVVVLTFFMAWSLYYVTMMLRRSHLLFKEIEEMVENFKERLQQLETIFKKLEEKITSTASYLPLLVKGVTELLNMFSRRREAKKNPKKDF